MHKFLIPVVFLYSSAAIAEGIYHWVDDEGKSHYGDTYTPGAAPLKLPGDRPSATQVQTYRAQQKLLERVVTQQASDRRAREVTRTKQAEKLARIKLKDQQRCAGLRDQLDKVNTQWSAKRRQGYVAEDKRNYLSKRKRMREQITKHCR